MRRLALVLVAFTVLVTGEPVAAAPEGQLMGHSRLAFRWGIGLVAGYAFFSAPYEDVKLKK